MCISLFHIHYAHAHDAWTHAAMRDDVAHHGEERDERVKNETDRK